MIDFIMSLGFMGVWLICGTSTVLVLLALYLDATLGPGKLTSKSEKSEILKGIEEISAEVDKARAVAGPVAISLVITLVVLIAALAVLFAWPYFIYSELSGSSRPLRSYLLSHQPNQITWSQTTQPVRYTT